MQHACGTHTHPLQHAPCQADWERCLRQSTTVYVGNLSFYTREEQIYEVFSKVRPTRAGASRRQGGQCTDGHAADTRNEVSVTPSCYCVGAGRGQVGHLEKVIMGLDKFNKTPCGFCFVIYYTR